MPRIRRCAPPGLVHHVINRGNNRQKVFLKSGDYRAFLRFMCEALVASPIRILAYCLMPNHFHLVLWPETVEQLSAYMRTLMNIQIRNYHQHYGTCGHGHIWQGRFRNFPVQHNGHLLRVLRYVEANPLRANLVRRAEEWSWSSLRTDRYERPDLTPSPIARPEPWLDYVNEPSGKGEIRKLRRSVRRGAPFGDADWRREVAKDCGLEFTIRSRGRPRREDTQRPSAVNEFGLS
jgi:putative transposase